MVDKKGEILTPGIFPEPALEWVGKGNLESGAA